MRRFSLAACWLLSWLAIGTPTTSVESFSRVLWKIAIEDFLKDRRYDPEEADNLAKNTSQRISPEVADKK